MQRANVGILCLVIAAAAVGFTLATPGKAPASEAFVGRAAPSFAAKPVRASRGGRLEDYRGEVALVAFWATWCSACKVEVPQLSQLAHEYAGRKVRVIAVSVDNRFSGRAIRDFIQPLDSSLVVLHDPGAKIMHRFGVGALPAMFVIDADGILRYQITGAVDWSRDAAYRPQLDSLAATITKTVARSAVGSVR